jgi:hypothetical protein
VAAGGKWKTNLKGFLFDGAPMAKLGLALESGVVIDEKKALQAFYTPAELAKRVVSLACIEDGHHILEPSAGAGALLHEMPGDTCRFAVEINPEAADKLHPYASVHCGDFLKWGGHESGRLFDRIVMNPPFCKDQDVKHVTHALKFLKPDGLLVAIMSPNVDRASFKRMVTGLDYDLFNTAPGAFKESGTNIATIIVRIKK